jgi:hypothetical protein
VPDSARLNCEILIARKRMIVDQWMRSKNFLGDLFGQTLQQCS